MKSQKRKEKKKKRRKRLLRERNLVLKFLDELDEDAENVILYLYETDEEFQQAYSIFNELWEKYTDPNLVPFDKELEFQPAINTLIQKCKEYIGHNNPWLLDSLISPLELLLEKNNSTQGFQSTLESSMGIML